jgi:tetratricopeptide (TPR) repeat protein
VETDQQQREHEEAIEPVKPPFAGTAGRLQSARPAEAPFDEGRERTTVLIGAAAVLLAAAAIGVVFVLPKWVGQGAEQGPPPAASAAATEPAQPAEPQLSKEELARLADRTESLLAELLTQQQQLEEMSAASWGGDDWSRYEQAAKTGDDAYLEKAYQDAIAAYEEAIGVGKDLLGRSAEITHKALEAGQQALAVGNAQLASEQFGLVLKLEADNEEAQAGRARAEKLPDVLEHSRRGDELRRDGSLAEAAAAYREALAIDSQWKPAADALEEVERRIAEQKFEGIISKGFSALSAEDYAAAEKQFVSALAMRPASAEAKDGLVQARQGLELDQIALAQARGLAFERRELWDRAIEQYEAALAADSSLDFAKTGLERARARGGLDAKLSHLIENPTLLFGDDLLASARDLLEQARAVPEPGPRLKQQISQLEGLIAQATTLVTVELTSDALTEVTLYRVGPLGAFMSTQVELRPGRYTAVGSRDGYRDVRKTFVVLPGRTPEPVQVVCVDPI